MNPGRIVTTAEMTAALKISKVRLNELARKGKVPRGPGPNQWDFDAVQSAVGRNLDTTHASPARGEVPAGSVGRRPTDRETVMPAAQSLSDSPARGSLAAADLLKRQAEAKLRVLEVRRLEKKLLDRDEVEDAVSAMISAARTKALVIADELADRIAAETNVAACHEMIMERVCNFLSALSEYPGAEREKA
jgi:hypothetical protein